MLGVSTCSAVYILFSLVVYDSSHRERKGFMVGAADSVSLLFELWFWQQQSSSSSERGRSLFIVGYTKILGTGSCSLLIHYFVSLVSYFLFSLPIFSRYAGPFDHAGVGFGSTKNTSSSTSILDLFIVGDEI